jgi:predicted esterase
MRQRSGRRWRGASFAWVLGCAIAGFACSDSADDVSGTRDAAVDGGSKSSGGAAACKLRCEPEQSLEPDDCKCSRAGVRMRIAALSEGFYAQPWPLDTRLHDNGALDLSGFPTPDGALFIKRNLPVIERATRGFSTTGAIFASFDGELDSDSLPTPEQSLGEQASAYLVEVEADSETLGERTPIACSYRRRETGYNPPDLLACVPVAGFPLRPATRYALVLTDRLRDADGERVRASQRMRDLLSERAEDDPLVRQLRAVFVPLADWLRERDDDAFDHVVGATVFSTQNPIAELRALAEDVRSLPAATSTDVAPYAGELPRESGNYLAFEGSYPTPIYQQGQTPYAASGGDIRFGADGAPVRTGQLQLRFALTVPSGAMPAAGWPVVLYHHGSGGDAYSFIDDGTAYHLAAAGVAAIGIDAPVHGTRNTTGDDPGLLFFNINNVLALRDNVRQGAVDLLVLERFVAAFEQAPDGAEIRFDRDNVFAMGHSQGGLTVPLMLPVAEHVRAAMLSGSGASITASILYKTAPLDIPALARTFLALESNEPLDAFHPVLALVQAFSDVSDPSNYVPYLFRWKGGRGVDVWATQGLADLFAPKPATDALVTALGLQPMRPLVEGVDGFDLRGIASAGSPVRANISTAAGGKFTGVYSQYAGADHFLIMNDPRAEAQLTHWFASLAEGGHGELVAP